MNRVGKEGTRAAQASAPLSPGQRPSNMWNSETGSLSTLHLAPWVLGNEEQGHGAQASSVGAACGAEQWVLLPEQPVQPAPRWQPGTTRITKTTVSPLLGALPTASLVLSSRERRPGRMVPCSLLQLPRTAELPAQRGLQ